MEAVERLVVEGLALNIFTRIGSWVEKHFPEKVTAEEVWSQIAALNGKVGQVDLMQHAFADYQELTNTFMLETIGNAKKISDSFEKLESELATIKSQVGFKSRIAGTPQPTPMTPFATRLPPVQPANSTPRSNGTK